MCATWPCAGHTPRLILLEVNVLDREPAPGTVNELFSPGLFALRRWYPGLQARHQPLNEALAWSLAGLAWLRPAAARQFQQKLGVGSQAPPAEALREAAPGAAALAPHGAEYDRLPAQPTFAHNLALLRRYVRYFTSRGARVVFFEMPLDAHACQGARLRYIRQQLAAAFPAGQLPSLPAPDCAAYRTTDGLHLTDPSAWRYSVQLAQELAALRAPAATLLAQQPELGRGARLAHRVVVEQKQVEPTGN